MLNRYGPILDVNVVTPIAPGRCRVRFDYYVDPALPDREAFMAASVAQSHAIQLEDVAICERVQTGLASPGYDRGPYAPRVEHALHHFHRAVAADLAAALAPVSGS